MENLAQTAENVELAVNQFYKEVESQNQVHQWLTLTQLSPAAWVFPWQLLRGDKSIEVQFFAASCLHLKISRFWHELPSDQRLHLRQKLMEAILSYAGGPKIVCTRLHVALASFVLQSISEDWKTPIEDIISALQPSNLPSLPPERVTLILTEILTVIPEEFQTTYIPQIRRPVVRGEIQKGMKEVLKVVLQLLDSSEPIHALRCISAWLQFNSSPADVNLEPLVDRLIGCVHRQGPYESALEALTTLLTQPDIHRYPMHVMKYVGKVLQLEGVLRNAQQEGDAELCTSIYAMFIAVGEAHSRLLLDKAGMNECGERLLVMKLMEIVLQCSATPGQYPIDESCSDQAFGFWFMIQDEILASENLVETYRAMFSPVYRALVDVFLLKSQYSECEWSDDDKEFFRCYRQDIADTLMQSYNVLRLDLLAIIHQRIVEATAKYKEQPACWQPLESCLHAFSAISEVIDTSENLYMPRFLQLLTTIPYNNVVVVGSAITAIGSYGGWLRCHSDLLSTVMPLLITGLSRSEVLSHTTHALRDLTCDCQLCIRPFAPQILQATQNALRSGSLKAKDSIRLMLSVGKVLSTLPSDSIMMYLSSMLEPTIKQLIAYGSQQATPDIKVELVVRLQMLGALFTTLDTKLQEEEDSGEDNPQSTQHKQEQANRTEGPSEPQPVLVILQEVFPPLQSIVHQWISDADVVEAVCEVVKQATGTLMDDCAPLVGDIYNLLMHIYQSHPQPSAINLAKQLLIMFGGDAAHADVMNSLLAHICMTTVSLCSANPSEQTHILDAFLSALAMVLRKLPNLFLKGLDLSMLFRCGVVAIALPEAPTVKTASQFLTQFILHSRDLQPFYAVVQQQGEQLVQTLLAAIRGDSPRALMEPMAAVLLSLNKKYPENLSRWLHSTISIQGFFLPRVTDEQKQHFVSAVLREKTNKRKLNEVVREFTLVCRGIMNTEYAAQTFKLL